MNIASNNTLLNNIMMSIILHSQAVLLHFPNVCSSPSALISWETDSCEAQHSFLPLGQTLALISESHKRLKWEETGFSCPISSLLRCTCLVLAVALLKPCLLRHGSSSMAPFHYQSLVKLFSPFAFLSLDIVVTSYC